MEGVGKEADGFRSRSSWHVACPPRPTGRKESSWIDPVPQEHQAGERADRMEGRRACRRIPTAVGKERVYLRDATHRTVRAQADRRDAGSRCVATCLVAPGKTTTVCRPWVVKRVLGEGRGLERVEEGVRTRVGVGVVSGLRSARTGGDRGWIRVRWGSVSGGEGILHGKPDEAHLQVVVERHRHVATHGTAMAQANTRVWWSKAETGHVRRRGGSHPSMRKIWEGRREPLRKHVHRPTVASNVRDGGMQETAEAQRTDFVGLARRLPAQRILIWGGVALTAYELKEFTGIAIGSFILCFLGNSIIDWAQTLPAIRRVPKAMRRKLLVVSYFSLIVLLVVGFGCLTVPNVLREGTDFISRLQNENMWIVVTDKMRQGLGDTVMNNLERFLMASSAGFEGEILPPALNTQPWTQERVYQLGLTIQNALRGYTSEAVSVITTLLLATTRITLQVLVSLALSFMIVWDLPRISLGVQSLAQSRLKPIYNEVAPSFISFGRLFGKALQAQATIACVNTALTCAGICLLALPGVVFLTLFVFICSFIPIAGCFISTVPIAFVALTEYGFIKVAFVLLMVVVIHFLEAYVLNPAIYAQHLKLHPLLVLTVLVVAESMFGVWGLLLAVPLTVFALDYCIRYPASSLEEVCAAEETNITPFESPSSPM